MERRLKLSHYVITSLYRTLSWYYSNRGAPLSPYILKLFDLWKSLHASFFNISNEGWQAIEGLAGEIEESLGVRIGVGSREDRRWLFLYALETYLNIVIRAITLSKLGVAVADVGSFTANVTRRRNIFEPNVFEWFFDSLNDQSLPRELREGLRSSINTLLEVISKLNLLYVTTDVFREVYQNILPAGVRKSLGEFYTSDEIVNRVLDAAGLKPDAIRELYGKWRRGERDTVILDPACGSGSFLVNVVKRIFNSFEDRLPGDIVEFVESNVVGIDINPFAVEMAKLNLIIAISSEMAKRGGTYLPSELKVYWADSLSRPKVERNVYKYYTLTIRVPALQRIVGEDSISIPLCPGVDPVKVLDEAVNHIISGGSSATFTQKVAGELAKECNVPEPPVASDLERLYRVLKSIYDSGNSRVISLLRNIIAVQALVGKCSYVVGNPPWVRIHNLDRNVLNYLRESYEWVRRRGGSGRGEESIAFNPGFIKTKTPFAEQIDYSVVFVERGLEFLREGGVLSYVITSKVARVTYAGKMREDLVKKYTLVELIDYSLYPIQLFKDVINYPLVISVRKEPPREGHRVRVTVYNTGKESRSFEIEQEALPLYSGTNYPNRDRSPWVLAPPKVVSALKKIVGNNPRLGDLYEVRRGVVTSLNEGYMGSIEGCNPARGLVRLRLESGAIVEVEERLVHPVIRGEDIDPFSFRWGEYIIFPHDTSTLEPLWDESQRKVLDLLGLLRQSVSVSASGGVLEYKVEFKVNTDTCTRIVDNLVQMLERNGYSVNSVSPCAVDRCLEVLDSSKNSILKVSASVQANRDRCVVTYFVSGLRIPNAPKATYHFTQLFEKLTRRDDYRANLPPWAIFRVSKEKFEEHRIAWQEMALHAEVTHLPVAVEARICGAVKKTLIVPIQTVYFIVEKDFLKAIKLLIYANSDIARSLVKLWAWSARGGYYRHTSYSMGLLPVPNALIDNSSWGFLKDYLKQIQEAPDLNTVAVNLLNIAADRVKVELKRALQISEDEYRELVEYGKWLNELEVPPQVAVEEGSEESSEEE